MLLGLEEQLACLLHFKLELDMQESLIVSIAVHGGRVEMLVLLKLLGNTRENDWSVHHAHARVRCRLRCSPIQQTQQKRT